MRFSRCLAPLAVALALAPAAQTADNHPVKAERHARVSTVTLTNETTARLWRCQDKLVQLGVRDRRDEFEKPRNDRYGTWILKQRQKLERKCLATLAYTSEHLIPNMQDWLGAVQWVQRIYPGTDQWMRYISDREGGWGRWVWYGGRGWSGYHVGDDFLGADTVGGWAQFRYSTFAPYWRAAQEDLKRRGYIIPNFKMPPPGGDPKYAAWLNPMGQALTMAYMRYTGKDGCHWCL